MTDVEFKPIPSIQRGIDMVVEVARDNGDYPQIFDEERLPQTIHEIIQTVGLPYRGRRESVAARLLVTNHLDHYLQTAEK